jgi:two-component system NtrC family sensor kinase
MTFKLQQKLITGVVVIVCLLGAAGYIAHRDLDEIHTKVRHVETAHDLTNTISDMRRAEKNYFLYNDREDFNQLIDFVARLETSFGGFGAESKVVMGEAAFQSFMSSLKAYKNEIKALPVEHASEDTVETVRQSGRQLYQFVKELSRKERGNIESLIARSQRILFWIVWFLLGLGLFAGHFIAMGIVRPLKTIEERTREIIKGNFTPLPEIKTHQEIVTLIKAFNRMIRDLRAMEIQADKLATLGTLLSGVAHELNNPISNISSSCQILMEEIEEADLDFKKRLLGQIQQQCDKSRNIVRSLLEYTRPKKFQKERINLKQLIEATVELLAGHIPAKVEIAMKISDEIQIRADKQRIEQAFLNLISNAIDAIPEDGGTITILAKRNQDKETVDIEVQDTGKGIAPENLSKIFNPFFSTKAVGQGTGMGLFITHQIIERIGGRITVESAVGKGTTFKVKLPCEE